MGGSPCAADKSVTESRSYRPPIMHLKMSSLAFTIWWLVLLLLHAVNVGYYIGAAVLYHTMRWTHTSFQLETYSIGISSTQYYSVSKIHWVVAIVHLLFMLTMVIGSLQARKLVFLPNLPPWLAGIWSKVPLITNTTTVSHPPNQPPSSIRGSLTSLTRRLPSFSDQSMVVTKTIFGREGLLGVDSVYFDHLLLARELLETSLQIIQVYRMSYLLPRVWLVRFYVILLIANCWSMPFLHRYYGNRHVERRMMSLLCDAVLDMVSSIGVSFWIFATYVPQYTDPAFGFPGSNWFDDVWFTNVQQEFQMMLVVSWADMASRLVFAVGLLQCMESIKEMLTPPTEAKIPRDSPDKVAAAVGVKPCPAKDEARREASLAENDVATQEQPEVIGRMKVVPDTVKPTKRDNSNWHRVVKFVLERVGPALFIVLGFAILIVHIVSETRQPSSYVPCELQVHPWFVSKPACSLVELDCYHLGGLSGSQESMEKAWHTYDFGATARLYVRHCPQLEMPTTLQHFRHLTGLKVYNSTITAWPKEAAFTLACHKNMRAFVAVRTNFSNGELPPGLFTAEYPQGLRSFTTSATNLHKLPDNLHERWPQAMTLVFERSNLREFPPVLTKLNPFLVSIAGNPITAVPPEMFEGSSLEVVVLSHTLVQELPRVVGNPSPRLFLMYLDGTNVSTFWSWMEPFVHFSLVFNNSLFTASGSRFCAERGEIVAGNRTSFSITTAEPGATDLASVMDVSTPEKLMFSQAAVHCKPTRVFNFPLELQDATTAIRP